MVKYSTIASQHRLDATFSALADSTRRAIVSALSQGSATVSELAHPHNMSLPAVMKHLRILEQAGLVSQHKVGRVRHCRLTAQTMKQAADWISQYRVFWESQFDALDRYLSQSQAEAQSQSKTESQTTEVSPCRKRKSSLRSNSSLTAPSRRR
jgi:DNA-binding transcriptional ArsR family regulator